MMKTANIKQECVVQLFPYIYHDNSGKWVASQFNTNANNNNDNDDFGADISAELPPSDNDENDDNDNKTDDVEKINNNDVDDKEKNKEVVDKINNDKNDEEKKEKDAKELNGIIVMSFNVWFGDYKFVERQKKLVEIMKDIKPDIFCFQEVTKEWVENIVKLPFIQNNYGITDIPSDLSTIIPYGVFIGVNINKFNILDLKICHLYSWMGRKLLSTKITSKKTGDIFWINTVHLESKNNTDFRIEQLQTIFDQYMIEMKQFDNKSTIMLMGDFNFRDNIDNLKFKENDYLKDDQFIDCWKQYANHNNLEIHNGWTRRVGYRYDRILMNISSKWNVTDFKILGDAENKIPSDHKGVVVYLN